MKEALKQCKCMDAPNITLKPDIFAVVSNDLIPEVIQGMQDKMIDFTIFQNPKQQGYHSLRTLYDLAFNGKEIGIEQRTRQMAGTKR
jgi:LacI family transcriptional regulator